MMSYGIYIWHLPIRSWSNAYVLPHWRWGEPTYFGLLVLLTGIMSVASYRLIETPALRLKDRNRPGPASSAAEDQEAEPAAGGSQDQHMLQ
jgi:peptidoglycan/LPS O-acetylase OafA/YrhL